MTFADSFLKSCWDMWSGQPAYSMILTCWVVPFMVFCPVIDLMTVVSQDPEDDNGPL